MVNPPQLTIIDVSALIAIVGATILYFGKIIEYMEGRHHKIVDAYMEGVFFLIQFLFLPMSFIVLLEILQSNFDNFDKKYFDILEYLITNFFIYDGIIGVVIYGLIFISEYSNLIKNSKSTLSKSKSKKKVNIVIMLLFAFCIIMYIYFTFKQDIDILFKEKWNYRNMALNSMILNILLFIVTYTILAFIYGFSLRRILEVTVYTENGKSFSGILITHGSDYIELLQEDKITRINTDKVIHIEEPTSTPEAKNKDNFIQKIKKKFTNFRSS